MAGLIDGGAGGYDTVVLGGAYRWLDYAITGPRSGVFGRTAPRRASTAWSRWWCRNRPGW